MTAREIIQSLGGYQTVADLLGVQPKCVSNWLSRSIPAKHWPKIVAAAKARDIEGVTFEVLANAKAER